MSEASKGALELLEQFRAERDELDILIRGLERKLGVSPSDTAQATATPTTIKGNPRATVSLGSIPVGFFHNLSQPNATEKLLRLNPGQRRGQTAVLSRSGPNHELPNLRAEYLDMQKSCQGKIALEAQNVWCRVL